MTRVALSWSSGKDSAWTLHVLRQTPDLELVALITTFNTRADRVAMHAVRRELVAAQAERAGLPLWPVELEWPCSNATYEELMAATWRRATEEHVDAIAFGDLFLEDVRAYRERQLEGTGLVPIFPVWGLSTGDLAADMIASGLRAKLTCVDPRRLDPSFAGRDFDAELVRDLPPDVDACGENGEFHTFVFDGPMFSSAIEIETGEIVTRDGFVFCDVSGTRRGGTELRRIRENGCIPMRFLAVLAAIVCSYSAFAIDLPRVISRSGAVRSEVIPLRGLDDKHQYSLLYSLGTLRNLTPGSRITVEIRQGDGTIAGKTLHEGDPDFYTQFAVTGTSAEVRVSAVGVPESSTYKLEVNRWARSSQVRRGPIHRWEDAMPIDLGKTVFASGDDAPYIPVAGTTRKSDMENPSRTDWYRFEFASTVPKLVFFQIELTERDQLPADVRVFRAGSGQAGRVLRR